MDNTGAGKIMEKLSLRNTQIAVLFDAAIFIF
jgi:hypothetical protein